MTEELGLLLRQDINKIFTVLAKPPLFYLIATPKEEAKINIKKDQTEVIKKDLCNFLPSCESLALTKVLEMGDCQ